MIHGVPCIEQRLMLNVCCCSVVTNPLMNGCGKFKGYYLLFVYFVKIRFQRKSKGTLWNSQSLQFHGEHWSLPRGCWGLIVSLFIIGCCWNLQYFTFAILLLLFWQFVRIKCLNQINTLSCSVTSAFCVSGYFAFWMQSHWNEPQWLQKEPLGPPKPSDCKETFQKINFAQLCNHSFHWDQWWLHTCACG